MEAEQYSSSAMLWVTPYSLPDPCKIFMPPHLHPLGEWGHTIRMQQWRWMEKPVWLDTDAWDWSSDFLCVCMCAHGDTHKIPKPQIYLFLLSAEEATSCAKLWWKSVRILDFGCWFKDINGNTHTLWVLFSYWILLTQSKTLQTWMVARSHGGWPWR